MDPRPSAPSHKKNRIMDKGLPDETTRVLTEFACSKFSAQVLDVL